MSALTAGGLALADYQTSSRALERADLENKGLAQQNEMNAMKIADTKLKVQAQDQERAGLADAAKQGPISYKTMEALRDKAAQNGDMEGFAKFHAAANQMLEQEFHRDGENALRAWQFGDFEPVKNLANKVIGNDFITSLEPTGDGGAVMKLANGQVQTLNKDQMFEKVQGLFNPQKFMEMRVKNAENALKWADLNRKALHDQAQEQSWQRSDATAETNAETAKKGLDLKKDELQIKARDVAAREGLADAKASTESAKNSPEKRHAEKMKVVRQSAKQEFGDKSSALGILEKGSQDYYNGSVADAEELLKKNPDLSADEAYRMAAENYRKQKKAGGAAPTTQGGSNGINFFH